MMSSETARPVAHLTDDNFSASIGGVGVSVRTGVVMGFFRGLAAVPGSVWLAVSLMMLLIITLTLLAAWYVAGTAIPMALGIINDGHAARDAAHSKDLDKVIAAFKESDDRREKHNEKMLDLLERTLKGKPFAVNPLEAGS